MAVWLMCASLCVFTGQSAGGSAAGGSAGGSAAGGSAGGSAAGGAAAEVKEEADSSNKKRRA